MKPEERLAEVVKILTKCIKLSKVKGKAYAGTDDALYNFKRAAERNNLTKYQIWSVYAGKHIDCIFDAIKENPHKPVEKSEGMEGRIVDLIVYSTLLHCLLKEDNDAEKIESGS